MNVKCPVCGGEYPYCGDSEVVWCVCMNPAVKCIPIDEPVVMYGPAYPPDAEHMAKYLASGKYDEAIRQYILSGKMNPTVVERFNALCENNRIEFRYCHSKDRPDSWMNDDECIYRLRPTPQYRAFKDAVEAAQHLGRNIQSGKLKDPHWSIDASGVVWGSILIEWDKAVKELSFMDTGEPFGVKVEP